MDEDAIETDIAKEDVVDAINDPENLGVLELLTDYYTALNKADKGIESMLKNARKSAQMLYDGKRYEEVVMWLDTTATVISDSDGPESEAYMAFTEDEALETLKLKASDKSLGEEEEEEDYGDDDE